MAVWLRQAWQEPQQERQSHAWLPQPAPVAAQLRTLCHVSRGGSSFKSFIALIRSLAEATLKPLQDESFGSLRAGSISPCCGSRGLNLPITVHSALLSFYFCPAFSLFPGVSEDAVRRSLYWYR